MATKVSQSAVLKASYKSLDENDSCPMPTQDVHLNLKNRDHAVKEYHYGPLNPNEPSDQYWKEAADDWGITVREAKKSRCGNCAAFIQTPKMVECMQKGIQGKDELVEDAQAVIEAANLGYCLFFEFKCAGDRSCHAWVVGGPIT